MNDKRKIFIKNTKTRTFAFCYTYFITAPQHGLVSNTA